MAWRTSAGTGAAAAAGRVAALHMGQNSALGNDACYTLEPGRVVPTTSTATTAWYAEGTAAACRPRLCCPREANSCVRTKPKSALDPGRAKLAGTGWKPLLAGHSGHAFYAFFVCFFLDRKPCFFARAFFVKTIRFSEVFFCRKSWKKKGRAGSLMFGQSGGSESCFCYVSW